MSTTIISAETIRKVSQHPNADRLELVEVLGYQVVTQKGKFKVGDKCVYFAPDILIPSDVAEKFGVAHYLKHAIMPGDIAKTQCRVGATRLRGEPSHGFVAKDDILYDSLNPAETGHDLTDYYNAKKYEPPTRKGAGDAERELENFQRYTNIENYQRYPDEIPAGTRVVITEKIHGTNCRMGLVRIDGEFQFVAGSHNVRRKNEGSLYWEFMDENMMNLLSFLCNLYYEEPHWDAVVYGEIFGPGIQSMDYGRAGRSLRVFDISLDGRYINHYDMTGFCEEFNILTVPELWVGDFNHDIVKKLTDGPTTFEGVKSKFKGREGVVIKPLIEEFSPVLNKRLILKSVSVDYRQRISGDEIGE